jgi:acyl dehydratase
MSNDPPLFVSAQALLNVVGQPLGCSDWTTVTQERIDLFAEATGDHQWIHIDPVRATQGPFGVTIAHGFLTLALANLFLPQIIQVQMRMGVNYGCERVRFPAPVRVGSRLRGRGQLIRAEALEGGVHAVIRVNIELENSDRPACVVDTINRYYF